MNSTQQTLTSVLVCAFIIAMYKVSDSAAQFVAMAIFVLVPVTIAYATIRIGKLLLNRSSSQIKRNVRMTKDEVEQRIANANQAKAISGAELMNIPAYARKQKGIHYPMTTDVLNGHVVVARG
ncbi:hypothetical protein [Vibrio sp. dhg]|uniref:hypothetical protein n=1 Tax=Vibrio sp. dhg TaxID=2163016 RepID=UPI000E4C1FBB|nr:hypothetical protein [Vibrio sp. dhg]AXT74178.1 hypothetical protein DBX26_24715 [Vibrio sp. dhg]